MEELSKLVKDVVVPLLKDISEKLESVILEQARHSEKIKAQKEYVASEFSNIYRKFESLKCETNERNAQDHENRMRLIEQRLLAGYQQDEECKSNTLAIRDLTKLVNDNALKNKEQEERYRSALRWIFSIIGGILILAGFAYFQAHWK